jgi:hypothetical protein
MPDHAIIFDAFKRHALLSFFPRRVNIYDGGDKFFASSIRTLD